MSGIQRDAVSLPLMALLVMDETAPACFRGSPAIHCGKLGSSLSSAERMEP